MRANKLRCDPDKTDLLLVQKSLIQVLEQRWSNARTVFTALSWQPETMWSEEGYSAPAWAPMYLLESTAAVCHKIQ